jgi:hypothetical protein
LSLAGIGDVVLKPNDEIVRIAYQTWVELSTRKIGLPFVEEHDVITEVYNSWYEAFGKLRELVKSIPPHQIQVSPDTRSLVEIMIKVLNDGLRPYLTTWQAKYRRWYTIETVKADAESVKRSPQEIQKSFPEYAALVKDLRSIESHITEYRNFLWDVARGRKRNALENQSESTNAVLGKPKP